MALAQVRESERERVRERAWESDREKVRQREISGLLGHIHFDLFLIKETL